MIFGERIEQAREFQGWTQVEVATKVGVKQAAIAQFESGRVQPATETSRALSRVLGFPVSFFERAPTNYFPMGTLQFRARASMSAREQRQAYSYGKVIFEIASALASQLALPPLRIPRLSGDPERAAAVVRSELGLSPDSAIPNLTYAMERAGVFVFALPDVLKGRDGFSAWAGDTNPQPALFLSAGAPGDRLRHTAAHELGELTLVDLPPGKGREKAADMFAGALLLPGDAMRRELIAPITLADLIALKPRWGVSIQALLMRAHYLELVSDRRYRTLFQQIGARGWRTQEPASLAVAVEKPRALRKMVELLYGEPIDYRRLGQDTALDALLLRRIIQAHASKADLTAKPASDEQFGALIPLRARK